MSYINLFEEFLNEEVKHVNNDVIHYTSDLISIIEKIGLSKDIDTEISLKNRAGLKADLRLVVEINPPNFLNYGSFKTNDFSKIVDGVLTNCVLYLQVQLTNTEIENNKISPLNKIRSLINHELNHALEIYQYKFNDRRYRNSWEVSKNQQEHRKFSKDWEYWDDFIYLIYLGLNHEMSSRISSIYEELKNTTDPKKEVLNNKTYMDADFMSKFDFDVFYNKFIIKYSENDFLNVCKKFCEDFDYKYINDIKFCKSMINRIVKSLNKKGFNVIKKIMNVIKRIENEKNPQSIQNEGFYDIKIDYTKYR